MRKSILMGVFFLTLFGAGVDALGGDFWPMVDGAVYTYESAGGVELVATYSDSTRSTMVAYPNYGGSSTYKVFSDDADGKLRVPYFSSMGIGGVDPDEWPFCPSFVFLDFPLFVGKSWSSSVYRCGDELGPFTVSYQVLREETITVPLGTFDVLVIEEAVSFGPSLGNTYYLNRDLGPVRVGSYDLVSATGTVAVESQTWGTVKALYR